MHFDLELFLVLASIITGAIWLVDIGYWAPRRRALTTNGHGPQTATATATDETQTAAIKDPWYVEYAKSFFPVLVIVLLLRGFVAEPFRIPSGSMMPTLLVGDFILVNKFAYGIRLPVTHTPLLAFGAPTRGDVAVFRFPPRPRDDYIKRIVGLPGDYIVYTDKQLYINGEPVPHRLVGTYLGSGSGRVMNGAERHREDLAASEHDILLHHERIPHEGTWHGEGEWQVPPGHYFVLGDNRDNSNDSRYWGFVPEANLVGKAFMIWMHWDLAAGEIQWRRIGDLIK